MAKVNGAARRTHAGPKSTTPLDDGRWFTNKAALNLDYARLVRTLNTTIDDIMRAERVYRRSAAPLHESRRAVHVLTIPHLYEDLRLLLTARW